MAFDVADRVPTSHFRALVAVCLGAATVMSGVSSGSPDCGPSAHSEGMEEAEHMSSSDLHHDAPAEHDQCPDTGCRASGTCAGNTLPLNAHESLPTYRGWTDPLRTEGPYSDDQPQIDLTLPPPRIR